MPPRQIVYRIGDADALAHLGPDIYRRYSLVAPVTPITCYIASLFRTF